MRSASDRFWSKVEPQSDGCWNWLGAISPKGYGTFHDKTFAPHKVHAHRWAYAHLVSAIPEGLTIDHLCRNRRCVNPAHLEAVTSGENVLRGEGIAAQQARKTHCKNGHEFTPENTIIVSGTRRRCRTCREAHYETRNRERREARAKEPA